jgi:hypothetical protein
MVYDVNGNVLTSVYNLMGDSLSQCYDKDGNPLISDTPEPPSRYRTFSVLADSYGAIQGGVTPDTNAVYYPAENNDVTEISQMWWYLFGESYGCTLERNNSFSGSRVANDPNWYAGIENSFIGRANNLGSPDLIIVLGGTNDVWNSIPLGEYVFSDWTEADKETFRGGLSYLFNYLVDTYGADVVFVCNKVALRPDWGTGVDYYQSAHVICDHMGIPICDVYPVVVGNHPTSVGMGQIRNAIMLKLGIEPNLIRNINVSLSLPASITWNPSINSFIVDHIEQYKLYRVTITVTAVGGSDTYVNVQASGSGTATFAAFSDYAGQVGTFTKIVEASGFVSGTDVTFSISAQGTTRTATLTAISIEEVSY